MTSDEASTAPQENADMQRTGAQTGQHAATEERAPAEEAMYFVCPKGLNGTTAPAAARKMLAEALAPLEGCAQVVRDPTELFTAYGDKKRKWAMAASHSASSDSRAASNDEGVHSRLQSLFLLKVPAGSETHCFVRSTHLYFVGGGGGDVGAHAGSQTAFDG